MRNFKKDLWKALKIAELAREKQENENINFEVVSGTFDDNIISVDSKNYHLKIELSTMDRKYLVGKKQGEMMFNIHKDLNKELEDLNNMLKEVEKSNK